MSSNEQASDKIYWRFVASMNDIIKRSGLKGGGSANERLLHELVETEMAFRRLLLSDKKGDELYKKFIKFIMFEKRNMISARVYFRERQDAFDEILSEAFRNGRTAPIKRLAINYSFASWAMANYRGPKRRALAPIYRRMGKIRRTLHENNLPLVLNRVKRFWYKVPEVHLEYMDHIQAASEGLLTAIDKYSIGESKFVSVAIGRITLNLLTDQNATMLKMSPREKRIQYRANMAKNELGTSDINDPRVLAFVREKFRGVTLRELIDINNASSVPKTLAPTTSSDNHDEEAQSDLQSEDRAIYMAQEQEDVVEHAEKAEQLAAVREALKHLSVLERKIVRLLTGE